MLCIPICEIVWRHMFCSCRDAAPSCLALMACSNRLHGHSRRQFILVYDCADLHVIIRCCFYRVSLYVAVSSKRMCSCLLCVMSQAPVQNSL